MNRKDFLQELIAKTESDSSKVHHPRSTCLQSASPPDTVKRLRVFQNNFEKIYPTTSLCSPQEGLPKQNSSYGNRKALVLQKVKNLYKKKDMAIHNRSLKKKVFSENVQAQTSNEVLLEANSIGFTSKQIHKFQTEYLKSESASPSKHFSKRSESAGGFSKIRIQLSQKKLVRPISLFKKQSFKSTSDSSDHRTLAMDRMELCKRPQTKKQQVDRIYLFSKAEHSKPKKLLRQNSHTQKPGGKIKKKSMEANKFVPIPKISSKSYIVCEKLGEKEGLKIHLAFKSKIRMEMASLTKIMTSILGLQLCQMFNIDPKIQKVSIGTFESAIGGTSAEIKNGDTYTLWDLFHGLMLPSGNDASLAIAVWGGRILEAHRKIEKQQKNCSKGKREYYERFIQEMNRKAKDLQLLKTTYANSHGLVNCINRSCAHDIAILSQYAMRNSEFRKIVSTKSYSTTIQMFTTKVLQKDQSISNKNTSIQKSENNSEESISEEEQSSKKYRAKVNVIEESVYAGQRIVQWQNTHKLVQTNPEEYIGIKTGVTTAAGPCLASCIVTERGRTFFIVLLNCKKLATRFKETEQLKKWIYRQQKIQKRGKKSEQTSRVNSILGFGQNFKEEYEANID